MAQLLADNRQTWEGQVRANTYHHHINWKLGWLMMDATRRRKSPPEMPKAGPLELLRKRKRVVDSNEEEEEEERQGSGEEEEEQGCGGKEEEARSEKGKEREE
ncbi:hypothetical protein C8R41DRAFT_871853 [Lentinula lateritia]|uniref:Uncharacterized protein n=1 Tax=Lentinula lateritia TaxID=40482 RepID=A0ABQ8UY31_9AGAR|nr:hypothetical protein C8R41DRAFT_871853 [Lentinula lateritia]